MKIELDPKKIDKADILEDELKKVTKAKTRILILAMALMIILSGMLAVVYKNLVLDFAEIDQLQIHWDPYLESVEFDYYVVTPGKLEFEFGDMLYRTWYKKSGGEQFSWGVPAMQGGEVSLTTRSGFKTSTYRKPIENTTPTGGS
jgi:hypothetical protein